MKNIKPHRIMLEFDENGVFKDGILIYQILDDSGLLDSKFRTISFKTELNIPVMNGIINKSIQFAQTQENKYVSRP